MTTPLFRGTERSESVLGNLQTCTEQQSDFVLPYILHALWMELNTFFQQFTI
jgi:hypothetical protein